MYHLSHFHFLSFLNTATNICVQLFVRVYVFISLGHIARSGLLDQVVILCVWFWENARLFSTVSQSVSQSVQSLSHVCLFATPWTAAFQASLSITNSWSLLKLISIESVRPTNHLILWHPLLLPPSKKIRLAPLNGIGTFAEDQFSLVSSVAQSCPTLCDPMNRSTPGLPVHHQLPEFTQTHVHRVGDAIQPSHPLSSPSPPAPNPSQHPWMWSLFLDSQVYSPLLQMEFLLFTLFRNNPKLKFFYSSK